MLGYGSIGKLNPLAYRSIPGIYPALRRYVMAAICTSSTETSDAAARSRNRLGITFNYPFAPALAKAKALIDAGALGSLIVSRFAAGSADDLRNRIEGSKGAPALRPHGRQLALLLRNHTPRRRSRPGTSGDYLELPRSLGASGAGYPRQGEASRRELILPSQGDLRGPELEPGARRRCHQPPRDRRLIRFGQIRALREGHRCRKVCLHGAAK